MPPNDAAITSELEIQVQRLLKSRWVTQLAAPPRPRARNATVTPRRSVSPDPRSDPVRWSQKIYRYTIALPTYPPSVVAMLRLGSPVHKQVDGHVGLPAGYPLGDMQNLGTSSRGLD